MNKNRKKIDLFGGVIIILLGIFFFYIAIQPVYKPQPGEQDVSILFQIAGIFIVFFGSNLIMKYFKSGNHGSKKYNSHNIV